MSMTPVYNTRVVYLGAGLDICNNNNSNSNSSNNNNNNNIIMLAQSDIRLFTNEEGGPFESLKRGSYSEENCLI